MEETDGVQSSHVNLEQDRATVVYQPKVVSTKEIKQCITDLGYQVSDVKEVQL
ncbi:heavy-metal-associated domain-containing protein [Halobacillus shinanisalinarum]|uniref:Heavy-metal-associated domain-containing protein n=1 Tax=Halobacillus shinanisalinarum TaxID=2932258 RepID=A0ABY4H176_9BACI|nr:heavy-metal-associated domain-containing protein [Halobacillus shinanisalinarum]